MPNVSKDTPLNELTLRRYEKPYNLSKRELVKKLCLSLGLLQPGDSRDVIVDVLYVLVEAKNEKKELMSERVKDAVIELRKKENLPLLGIASSNIRRQLQRLRQLLLVEKIKNNYRATEFLNLHEAFEEKVEKYLLPSVISRVKDYLTAVDNEFDQQSK
jgi:hypothetical protein